MHGNFLTVEEWEVWATLAHVLGFGTTAATARAATTVATVPAVATIGAGQRRPLAAIIERRIEQAEQLELFV
ncbi:MAG: hypothetical protein IPP85_17730 [Propionivibrio sp.]|nr:hypothetical protein [Propionivibrio sp.]